MQSKRGLSEVITTLIIILLVIAAIGIIWAVVNPFIRESSEEISLAKFTLDLGIKNAYLDGDNVIVRVQRGQGEGDLVGLKFVISDGLNSIVVEKSSTLVQQEMETYTLDGIEWLDMVPSDVTEVSVAPVYATTSGTAVTGEIADTYIIGSGSVGDGSPLGGCTPNCAGKFCGDDNGCSGTCTSCLSGTCVSGVCEGCTPGTCASLGYECGTGFNNGCGGVIDCSIPGCGELTDTCINGICVPEACVPANGSLICAEVECGMVTNELSCGIPFDCSAAGIDCSAGEECVEHVCEEITYLDSGTIDNVWPPGSGIYFDDDALPEQDGLYYGAAAYFPDRAPTDCYLIVGYSYDSDVYANAIVEINLLEPLPIAADDAYQIWDSMLDCSSSLTP